MTAASEAGIHPFAVPGFLDDPYPVYAALRDRDPVHPVVPPGPAGAGEFILTRHADLHRVLHDSRFSVDRTRADRFREEARRVDADLRPERQRRSMLQQDPPEHTRLRRLVHRAFTPRRVEALAPRIERRMARLLDAAGRTDPEGLDVVRDLAEPLPALVIAELLGVPPRDHARFRSWSHQMLRVLSGHRGDADLAHFRRARRELEQYLWQVVQERRREPRDDLVTALTQAHDRDDALSDDELIATCRLLLIAGHETTSNAIANGVLCLLRAPAALARLRRDPDATASAVEEILRTESPIQGVARVALEDVEIGGRAVPAGALLTAMVGAANRDPEIFADPDRFDVDRGDEGHLAFGFGVHFCLGAALARLETTLALRGLLDRHSRLERVGVDADWRPSPVLRGLRSLRVRTG